MRQRHMRKAMNSMSRREKARFSRSFSRARARSPVRLLFIVLLLLLFLFFLAPFFF